jgi:hypothetical protein
MLAEYIVFGYLLRYITAINANADVCIDGIEHKDDEIFGAWCLYSSKKYTTAQYIVSFKFLSC